MRYLSWSARELTPGKLLQDAVEVLAGEVHLPGPPVGLPEVPLQVKLLWLTPMRKGRMLDLYEGQVWVVG